mmetsp:Transcript_15412/g.37959  ORF Transcript_15412/g.37959 Transcript_15412/m.37959 type:complete len:423 (+) Transcript_15412:154-1422(+)
MRVQILGWLTIFLSFLNDGTAFRAFHLQKQRSGSVLKDSIQDISLEERIRAMPAKQIKEELVSYGISTAGLFEKEHLVQRLLVEKMGSVTTDDSKEPTSNSLSGVISTPLYFTSLDAGLRIAAVNSDHGISVNPNEKPYSAIKIQVQGKGTSFTLQLLLDTACSGLVLRPSVVKKWNLPESSMPVTMTGAGGSSVAQGLTQLSFEVGDKSFGPLPAAIQDIGALPGSLDGIIGLSGLGLGCVDLDFVTGQLRLYDRVITTPAIDSVNGTLVGNAQIHVIPQLGLYAVDVYLGGRGPVKMLIDSGASFSALNWNGIDKLGISRDDESFLKRLSTPMGAMGSDSNVAQLTHRIHVSSVLHVGTKTRGLSLKNDKRLPVDIGNIAILDALASYNVVGILGIDALMRCSCVRLQLETEKMELLLFE